jgi:hypothetical protein
VRKVSSFPPISEAIHALFSDVEYMRRSPLRTVSGNFMIPSKKCF